MIRPGCDLVLRGMQAYARSECEVGIPGCWCLEGIKRPGSAARSWLGGRPISTMEKDHLRLEGVWHASVPVVIGSMFHSHRIPQSSKQGAAERPPFAVQLARRPLRRPVFACLPPDARAWRAHLDPGHGFPSCSCKTSAVTRQMALMPPAEIEIHAVIRLHRPVQVASWLKPQPPLSSDLQHARQRISDQIPPRSERGEDPHEAHPHDVPLRVVRPWRARPPFTQWSSLAQATRRHT